LSGTQETIVPIHGGVDGIEHLKQRKVSAVVFRVGRHHVAALWGAELSKERVQGSRIVVLSAERPDPPAVEVEEVVEVEPQFLATLLLLELGDVPICAFGANEGAKDRLFDVGACHGRRDRTPTEKNSHRMFVRGRRG